MGLPGLMARHSTTSFVKSPLHQSMARQASFQQMVQLFQYIIIHGPEDRADRQPARDHSSSSPTFYGNPHDSPDPHVSHVSHVPRQYRPYRTIRPESHEPPDLPTALRHVGAHQHMHHTQRTALPRSTHHTSRLATSRASRRPPRTPTARAHPTISSTRRRGASSCSTCTMSRSLTPHTTRWPRPLSFPSL